MPPSGERMKRREPYRNLWIKSADSHRHLCFLATAVFKGREAKTTCFLYTKLAY